MNLLDVIRDLDTSASHALVYAKKPWTENSQTFLIVPGQSGRPADRQKFGLDYFLDIATIRKILVDPAASSETPPQKIARLIHHASTSSV